MSDSNDVQDKLIPPHEHEISRLNSQLNILRDEIATERKATQAEKRETLYFQGMVNEYMKIKQEMTNDIAKKDEALIAAHKEISTYKKLVEEFSVINKARVSENEIWKEENKTLKSSLSTRRMKLHNAKQTVRSLRLKLEGESKRDVAIRAELEGLRVALSLTGNELARLQEEKRQRDLQPPALSREERELRLSELKAANARLGKLENLCESLKKERDEAMSALERRSNDIESARIERNKFHELHRNTAFELKELKVESDAAKVEIERLRAIVTELQCRCDSYGQQINNIHARNVLIGEQLMNFSTELQS